MEAAPKMLAIWLLPAPPRHEFFKALIDQLAERFDAPSFEPHLTLCGIPIRDADQFDEALRRMVVPDFIELEVAGIECSDQFTKTLFVQFKPSNALLELRDAVLRSLREMNGHKLNPHLSLIYQKMPNEQKAGLARTIELPFARVRFAAFKAVVTPGKIESREGVEAWATIWERSFS